MNETETVSRVTAGSQAFNQSLLKLVREDITTMEVEAFVFYARPSLTLGSGFGSAIATRGGPAIKRELERIGTIQPTEAILTSAGNLKAHHIVHAAGPAFQEEDTEKKLRATILNALKLAEEKGIRQIALPAMGAGFYGIPLALCTDLMVRTVSEYLARDTRLREVIFCANDNREYRAFEERLRVLRGSRS